MAAITGTTDNYVNQNFALHDCDTHNATPNIDNPCICMMPIESIYIGTTGRVFMRVKREEGEICNDTDWVELASADGAQVASKLTLSAGTATKPQMNLADGVEPTTPVAGDVWREGNALHIYLDAEYTLDMTAV